ncbi:SGNH/GDSL hydrolase family protein [Xanthobacter sp. DSM 24535]|uniref:SGNH/GDSL hydrolase family protein n=1 Tax=Roseixanthobacter psychrophilus TaxID=3119917 RepID=UPI0037284D9F
MLIESIIQREGGTPVDLHGRRYHFCPDASGRHVAAVEESDDIAAFLAIAGGFRVAGGLSISPRRHYRILCGIDSLTTGGGDPIRPSFLGPFAAALKSLYGDGGPGLIWFDTLSPNFYALPGSGGTAAPFTAEDWDAGARSHTLCGRGTLFTGSDGGLAGLDPGVPWDRARVYFELSAGASWSGDAGAGTGVTADTTIFPAGTLCSVDVRRNGVTALGLYDITGTLTLFGVDFLNDEGGITVSDCGVFESTLADHAGLDDGWAHTWAQLIQPDLYLLNAGMNDRITSQTTKFGAGINTLVSRWQSSGRTQVVLVRPSDTDDADITNLSRYELPLRATALARGCGYVDDRDALGGAYAQALVEGLMFDGQHPNAAGNQRRADAYVAAVNSLRGRYASRY